MDHAPVLAITGMRAAKLLGTGFPASSPVVIEPPGLPREADVRRAADVLNRGERQRS